jgi:multicomponent Na+:H+ antiporter subunit G
MLDFIVTVLLISGLVFYTGGTVGILRMPDFYTRLHPAGKMDTLGAFLVMLALCILTMEEFSLNAVLTGLKILLIVVFVFFSSPTATHSIVDAGIRAGLRPWTKHEPEK